MPFIVTTGSKLQCTMGTMPSAIIATPSPVVATTPACTIMDIAPGTNIPPFLACVSPAKGGTVSPQPCTPAIVLPWVPGSMTSTINGQPVLTDNSKCACTFGGVISVVIPAQQLAQST